MRWLLLLGLAACAAEPMSFAPEAFVPVSHDADPLVDHRPGDAGCPVSTWGPEDGAIEVQTGACAYFAAAQAVPVGLRRGDVLTAAVWHADLDAAEPGTGHVALLLDGAVLWETTVDIPCAADVYPLEVALSESIPEGATLGWHLHNHGYNSWKLGEVTLLPGG